MKRKITFLLSALFALTLITQPVKVMGQERAITMGSGYTVINTVLTSVSNNDLVVWGTSNTSLGYEISSNKLACNSTSSNWIVFKVIEGTNGFYLQNTDDNKYVYSSAAKKIEFHATSKTLFTIVDKGSDHTNILYGANVSGNTTTNIGYYTYNNDASGIRPYASNAYTDAHLYKVIPPHTLNYSATNGSIAGVNSTTSATVNTGASLAYGTVVNLTATPNQGYEFVSWSDGGTNTLSNINGNHATFTMGEANVTITATFTQASSDPTITATPASLTDFSCVQNSGNASASQSFAVSGANLDANITVSIAANSDFEMSAQDGENWSSTTSITLNKDGNNAVAETNIYVRMKASTTYGDKSGSISITSTNATDKSVSLSGNVIQAKTINWHHGADGTSTATTNTYVGATLAEFPTAATVNGWTFIGWAASYTSGYPVTVTAPLTVTAGMGDFYAVYRHGNNVIYQLTTSTSDLSAGTRYMMGYYSSGYLLMTTNFGGTSAVSLDANNKYTYTTGTQWTLGGSNNAWTFTDANGKLLSSQSTTGNSASLKLETTATDYSYWSISYDDASPKHSKIQNNGNVSNNSKNLKVSYYNSTFNCFDNAVVYLFKEVTEYSKTPTIELCYVTYDANGATEGDVPTDGTGYNPSASVTILGNTGSLAKTGHTWSGWCLNEAGTGTVYGPTYTATYPIPANTTFYAKWNINSYTYTLNDSDEHVVAGLEVGGESYTASTIPYNTEVEVVVDTDDGYGYTISVKDGDDNDVTLTNNTFNMPASTVTITVTSRLLMKYVLVTSDNQLIAGKHYVIASGTSGNSVEGMGYQKSNNRDAVDVEFDNGKLVENDFLWDFVLGGDATNGWTFYDKYTDGEGFLRAPTSNNNYLTLNTTPANYAKWSISIASYSDGYKASVVAKSGNRKNMRYNSSSSLFACYEKSTDQSDIYLFVKDDDTDYEIYSASPITGTHALTSLFVKGKLTIKNNAVITVSGEVTNSTAKADSLIIEDGGQLITSSTGVKATIKKDIAQAANGQITNWYLISSPVGTVSTDVVAVNDINLYAYNEANLAWNGYLGSNGFENLVSGKGYLYRNSEEVTLSFTGTIATPGTVAGISLTCDNEDDKYAGFNLLGNPYSQKISSSCISLSDDAKFTGVYTLGTDGGWYPSVSADINPCEGFLVKVDKATTVTFGTPAKGTTYNNDYIQFTVANSQYEDVAYALFNKGNGLTKINHRNADIPMLYINQNDRDYAIANFSDNTKSFSLNFKAMTTGKYTLSYNTTGEYNYLHIIDRLTGADVDMLLEGEYSFIATPSDNTNRFIVRLEYMPNYSEGNAEIFAFQNGNEVLVSGSGELQIFDVTGRSVMTTTINGAESINLSTPGVYIFRLVGNEVKTQKIVVR